ncbi:flagellar basal body-associated FliL family protein [Solidesulfovibrio carbinolicus]|uniref:Flagellar protein FliL n=1 Tax=Solidesulfovibrio carbinolicus TaxID=296842 RepID=A0A4P6HLC0_9BACT|nr:flagellar basal body-associated FliL family protein [Solidesulfovibrio carbinolicus]QAZ67993.1 flagellar basal body protein FliL [Solidesulfovibrio carbinolicus]
MRRSAIGLALILALFLALPQVLPASSGGGEAKKQEKKEEKKEKKEPGKVENGVITIGPMTVNILSKKGYRFMRLEMIVECVDDPSAERLYKADAREDLILMLSNKLAEDLLTNSGKMILRKELMDLFTTYAGPGKVKNIYFGEFVFQ